MSAKSKATKDEIQRNRNEAYQGGWGDGYAEGYGKAEADRRDPAVLAELLEVKAMVAAAYLDAAAKVHECWTDGVPPPHYDAHILTLTPSDAKAALDAHVAAEVRKALEGARNATASIHGWSPYVTGSAESAAWISGAITHAEKVDAAILAALIAQGAPDA
jgi:hypothetical protein